MATFGPKIEEKHILKITGKNGNEWIFLANTFSIATYFVYFVYVTSCKDKLEDMDAFR